MPPLPIAAAVLVSFNANPHPFLPLLWTSLAIAAVFGGLYLLISKPEDPRDMPALLRPANYFGKLMLPAIAIGLVIGLVSIYVEPDGFDQMVFDGDSVTFRHSLVGDEVRVPITEIEGAMIDSATGSRANKASASHHTYYYASIALRDGQTLKSRGGDRDAIAEALEEAGFVRPGTTLARWRWAPRGEASGQP